MVVSLHDTNRRLQCYCVQVKVHASAVSIDICISTSYAAVERRDNHAVRKSDERTKTGFGSFIPKFIRYSTF